jgi:integrase
LTPNPRIKSRLFRGWPLPDNACLVDIRMPGLDGIEFTRELADPCRVHDIRHTAISWWLNDDGMPLASVRDRAGHWNISITSRYIHAKKNAEDDAVNRSAA